MASFMSSIYKGLLRPALFHGDAERAHMGAHHALGLLQSVPRVRGFVEERLTVRDPRLEQAWGGMRFANPIGLAAGFDKEGGSLHALQALGFGFLEAGTVTRWAQPGNARPRLFRLTKDRGLKNRMGFNGPGADAFAARLAQADALDVPLIINIGLSKRVSSGDMEAVVEDYRYTLRAVYAHASAVTVNVSSPNTKGLRDLQRREPVKSLLLELIRYGQVLAHEMGMAPKALLVKIAPDLDLTGIMDILEVCHDLRELHPETPIGIIATNTTLKKNGLRSLHWDEQGGVSGQPLTERAQEVAIIIRSHLPEIFLVGVGGIQTVEQAVERLTVANVVQLYTGLVYEGPALVRDLNRGVLAELTRRGLRHMSELRTSVERASP